MDKHSIQEGIAILLVVSYTTWQEAKALAQRRVRWRAMVDALCSQEGDED